MRGAALLGAGQGGEAPHFDHGAGCGGGGFQGGVGSGALEGGCMYVCVFNEEWGLVSVDVYTNPFP